MNPFQGDAAPRLFKNCENRGGLLQFNTCFIGHVIRESSALSLYIFGGWNARVDGSVARLFLKVFNNAQDPASESADILKTWLEQYLEALDNGITEAHKRAYMKELLEYALTDHGNAQCGGCFSFCRTNEGSESGSWVPIVFPAMSVWMSRLCIATGTSGVTTLTISALTSRLAEKYSELE